ncbi:MAG: hypothetical protein LW711_07055 [Saprospiraceae bacterium]|nr:hypothetical protein [Saprospiraceae bacterium]
MKEVTDIFLWIGLGFLAYFIFYVFCYKISDFKSFLFSCFLFCSAQNTLTTYVVSSDYIEWMPHVFRSAGFVVYLISPLIFLYIRELLFQKGYQKYDWVHILPGVFYVIDHIPFYLMDGEAKLEIVNHLKSNGTLFLHQQGYFKDFVSHMLIRNSLTVIYLIGITYLFFKFVKTNGFLPFLENKVLLWKVLFLFYILFTFAIPPLITVLELTPYSAENFYLILFSVIGMISLFILFLFTRKES